MTFTENLKFGKLGESVIASWLRRRGWNLLPAYEKESGDDFKGPALFQATGEPLVSPDLLAFQSGRLAWFEVKRKSAFTWYRATGHWQTGIDSRHFREYQRVRRLSDWPVWILFLHEDGVAKDTPAGMVGPTGLFGEEIDLLARTVDHEFPDERMVYWNRETLKKIAHLDEVQRVA